MRMGIFYNFWGRDMKGVKDTVGRKRNIQILWHLSLAGSGLRWNNIRRCTGMPRHNNSRSFCCMRRKGVALIVVLFLVMVATILSLGFVARSDVELSCGKNMILRTQMDYLAESGLEHAKGLILNGQSAEGSWTDQLVSGSSDYYRVTVSARHPSFNPHKPNQPWSCQIASTAYREKNHEKIGESTLRAELYVDPLKDAFFRSIERQ